MAEYDLFDTGEKLDISSDLMDEQDRLDQDIRACFNSRAGRRVMKHLEEIVRQPAFDAGLGLLNGIANGFSREGQVALITYLNKRARRAEEK